jgi:hypothetical protein
LQPINFQGFVLLLHYCMAQCRLGRTQIQPHALGRGRKPRRLSKHLIIVHMLHTRPQ